MFATREESETDLMLHWSAMTVRRFRSVGGPMATLRVMIRFLFAVASRLLGTLTRIAKRWAAPGAGPKLVSG